MESRAGLAWPRLCAVLLIACRLVVSAQTTNDTSTQATSGVSSLTPAQWPVPSSMKLIQHERYLVTGRNIYSRRLELEAALKAALLLGVPSNGAARTTNYTTIPAITPGYEDLNAIVYELDVYLTTSLDPQKVSLPPKFVYLTMQLLDRTLKAKLHEPGAYMQFSPEAAIMLPERYYTSTPAERAAQPVVTADDTERLQANTLSRIQLSGEGLLPFNADKQAAFALAVFYAFDNATSLYTLNVTDFTVPQTTVRHRKLLQGSQPSVMVNVWTQNQAQNYSASAYWNSVFSSGALRSVGPMNLTLTGKFMNATTQLRTFNETIVGTLYDPPQQQGAQSSSVITADAQSSSTGSSGLSAGAIAGIALGCAAAVALLAAGVILLCKQRQRRRAAWLDAKEANAKDNSEIDSTSSTSYDSFKLNQAKATDISFESVVNLWEVPTVVTGLDLGIKGRAPELDAEDIKICISADGKRVRLGGGTFSTVYRGRHHRRDVAVKELSIEDGLATVVQREVQLAELVSRDANVVQFYGVAAAPDGASVLLVMEFMAGGDLRAALDGPDKVQFLWHNRGARIARDIAHGLAYIHTTGVVHRDLKSSNVLLSAAGTSAKVADIGSAALLDASQLGAELTGTLAWAAPELLCAERHDTVDAKADSYSLGVVLWELCTGEMPTRGAMRPLQPQDCPPAVAALITSCMAAHPADRPTAVEVSEQLRALAA